MSAIKCSICGSYIDEKNKDNCPSCTGKNIAVEKRSKTAQPVRVIDFDMSFGSMVMFMVKWAIASIPAMIILFIIWMILMMIVGGTVDWSIEI